MRLFALRTLCNPLCVIVIGYCWSGEVPDADTKLLQGSSGSYIRLVTIITMLV